MSSTWLMIGNTLLMAFREIRRNTLRSTLTTLGIIIGVAAVIALVTLGEGATAKVTEEITSLGVNMLAVGPGSERRGPGMSAAPPFTYDDVRAIERDVSSVSKVAPSSGSSSLVIYENKSWNSTVTGITNDYLSVRSIEIEDGRMFTDAELSGGLAACVLGQTLVKELFGSLDPLGKSVRVGRMACRVVGTTVGKGQSTFGFDQDEYVLMPLSTFQKRIAGNTNINSISVSAVSESMMGKAKQQLSALLRERRRVAPGEADDLRIFDSREMLETMQTVTGVLTALLGAVAAVSLLVGGIGIMNIMLVSVTERTREIGIRLAIGARGREVLLQFLVEAIVLCVLGGILGMILGLGGAYAAGRALDLPFRFLPQVVVIAVGFSACIGIAFGFFPARKAARLNPIEALRHE